MGYSGFGAIKNTFADGAVGGVPPIRKSTVCEEVGNILCCPFTDASGLVDLTSNHTFTNGPGTLVNSIKLGTTNGAYTHDGNNMLGVDGTSTDAPQTSAGAQAANIPLDKPVSMGLFVKCSTFYAPVTFIWNTDNSFTRNYGLIYSDAQGLRFQSDGYTDIGFQEYFQGNWVHIGFVVEPTGGTRATTGNVARAYINGKKVWDGTTQGCGFNATTMALSLTEDLAASAPSWDGFIGNVFISDNIITGEQFAALSDEAFGHASPYALEIA